MDIGTLSASISSSLLSRIITYPLDTIAVQHTSSTRRPLLSVPLSSYYRGLPVSLIITTPAIALYLCTYRQSKETLTPYLGDSTLTYVCAGVGAEVVSSLLWTPLEVVKARAQISRGEEGRLRGVLGGVWRAEGVRGFYRGYALGLGIYIPYNAIWWSVYENSKKNSLLERFSLPTQAAISSALAVTFSAGFIHPLDLVKTRYQVATSDTISALSSPSPPPALPSSSSSSQISKPDKPVPLQQARSSDRQGIRQIIRNVRAEGGWISFYRGFFPRLGCSIPSSLIMMSALEYLKPDVARDREREEQVI